MVFFYSFFFSSLQIEKNHRRTIWVWHPYEDSLYFFCHCLTTIDLKSQKYETVLLADDLFIVISDNL
jgi:hypothetical protein